MGNKNSISLLCLGDSYTIGEGVPIYDSFPYQLVQMLRQKNFLLAAPEIVAKTGFTTTELKQQIEKTKLLELYNFFTLLIGVNNQYRGYEISIFENEFEYLLNFALSKVAQPKNGIVLSIPDWGKTPFAKDRNTNEIEQEINNYNFIKNKICTKYKVHFIDINYQYKLNAHSSDFLAGDSLHPSGKEYYEWANKISAYMLNIL